MLGQISCALTAVQSVQVWTGENLAAKDIILDSEDHVINQAMFATSPWYHLHVFSMLKLFDQDGYQYAVLRRYDQHQEDGVAIFLL